MCTAAPPTFKVGLTQDEKELYSQLFRSLDPERSGIVTGEKARSTFEKSGLPPSILGEIWQLADNSNMGFLSQFGFCFAMRLIGYTQSGQYPTAQLAETPGPLPKFSGLVIPSQLVPQGTSNSLLQTQPSAYVPQNNQLSSQQDAISPVSAADFERFSLMFEKTTGSKSSPLDGNAAKEILTKAKLPTVTLGQIWSLVDVNNKGQLDLPAFVMAMHLIHGLLSGSLKQLPPFLPDHLWKSVRAQETPSTASFNNQSFSSQITNPAITTGSVPLARQETANQEWIVSPLQREQFNSIFEGLDTAKTGSLGPEQVANFLKTSRLDQQDLAVIWDLADIENTGTFTKLEFSIALFLVNRRRAGMALPNIVPGSLIASLRSVEPPKEAPIPVQAPPATGTTSIPITTEAKTSTIDELADIFGSPAAPATPVKSPPPIQSRAPLQQRTSSSDLTSSQPKLKSLLTSSFAPTSEFGKSLMALQPPIASPSLIGDDVAPAPKQVQETTSTSSEPAVTANTHASVGISDPASSAAQQNTRPLNTRTTAVDYEALRNVPAPPRSRGSYVPPPTQNQIPNQGTGYFLPAELPPASSKQENTDLLADAETAGKLSEANTDIANISNQVKSLTTQTSNLHEKKIRAEQELTRILKLKEDIDAKLKLLRTSYANEVKQVEQVETTLGTAKEEAEALRSEASIAEAKLNHLSGELHEKQLLVEEHQKTNSTLREKLGNVNAEIAELTKQLEAKAADGVRLENEANVRKSQHHVALVKIDELKNSLKEAESKNEHLQLEIHRLQKEESEAVARAKELENSNNAAKSETTNLEKNLEEHKKSHSLTTAAAVAAGAAGAAVLGAVGLGAAGLGSDKGTSTEAKEIQSAEPEFTAPALAVENPEQINDENDDIDSLYQKPDMEKSHVKEEVTVPEATVVPGSFPEPDVPAETEKEVVEPINTSDEPTIPPPAPPVAALVDEVVEHPAQDMTGLDDIEQRGGENPDFEAPTEYEQEETSQVNDKFPDISNEFDNFGSVVQASTNSYKPTEGGTSVETPVTSPDVSEYRFQSSNVVGGMVGMPGVLVGVQRTDSLTSSIQNNPSMSVRDDNIDEVSDRDVLDEVTLPLDQPEIKTSADGERSSSGAGSFEIVNSEEAKGHTGSVSHEQQMHPLSQSHKISETDISNSQNEEEFPPIRELDYDESSSDDDQSFEDKYDDAVDEVGQLKTSTEDFDGDFDNLRPATEEFPNKSADDMFGDEFDDLKVAEVDIGDDIDPVDISINDQFTEANPTAANQGTHFDAVDSHNDEWEQLFAGFGNVSPLTQPVAVNPAVDNPDHDLAIAELTGMGFSKDDVIKALERENWDVEAATNYLLDHA